MKRYIKAVVYSMAMIIPLNIVASWSRPHWSIGGEILILPLMLALAVLKKGNNRHDDDGC